MKAKRTHDVVATIGTYKDRDGNEKKRYQNCGSVFTGEDGRMSLKLDALPVSKDWSGFFSLYEVERKEERREPQQPAAGRYENAAAMHKSVEGEDDIPF